MKTKMKTYFLTICLLIAGIIVEAQNVNIPDANFKAKLISLGVDTGGDGEISKAEAEAVTDLDLYSLDIADLTGIEAFMNLETLNCYYNDLTNLDLSKNIKLEKLWCYYNNLTSLDLSNNINLEELYCSDNELTSLDLSNNIKLKYLECEYNKLTSLNLFKNIDLKYLICMRNQFASLDLSDNINLETLHCASNPLTSLDLSNNINLETLYCTYNPIKSLDLSNNPNLTDIDISNMQNLEQVCVWTMPFPPAGVTVNKSGSDNVYFEDCSSPTAVNDLELSKIKLYPNPVGDILHIDGINDAEVVISNLSGQTIYKTAIMEENIDISNLKSGIYFVRIAKDGAFITRKIVKL